MSSTTSAPHAAAAAPQPEPVAPGSRGYIFFDLDNTLYSFAKTGVDKRMGSNIIDYVTTFCGLSADEAITKTNEYYATYGLTIAGLVRHHDIDPMHYCRYVHNVGVDELIERDHSLIEMMSDLKRDGWNLWVLTNAVMSFAVDVLKKLGVYEFFEEDVLDDDAAPAANGEDAATKKHLKVLDCFAQWAQGGDDADHKLQTAKPQLTAYELAMQRSGAKSTDVMVMVEDSLANLHVPNTLGWLPVWIGYGKSLPDPANQPYHVLDAVHALPTLLSAVAPPAPLEAIKVRA